MRHHADLKKFILTKVCYSTREYSRRLFNRFKNHFKSLKPDERRNFTFKPSQENCYRSYFNPLYMEQRWFIFHINAEYDFQTHKWNYPKNRVRGRDSRVHFIVLYFLGPRIALAIWLPLHTNQSYHSCQTIHWKIFCDDGWYGKAKICKHLVQKRNKFFDKKRSCCWLYRIGTILLPRLWTILAMKCPSVIPRIEASKFCEKNQMDLWYPSVPFGDVPPSKKIQMNLKPADHFLFWSSLIRINLTHFKTPINEIVLDEWISMEYGETRNSPLTLMIYINDIHYLIWILQYNLCYGPSKYLSIYCDI